MNNNSFKKNFSLVLCCLGISTTVWSMQLTVQNGNQPIAIVKTDIQQYKTGYNSFVLSKQKKISTTHNWLIQNGAFVLGYNAHSVKCIPVSYRFFTHLNRIKKELKEIGKEAEHLPYINDGLNQFTNSQEKNKNVLSKILHYKHVDALTLPADVNKENLKKNPETLASLVDNRKVVADEYYRFMMLNLFIQYYLEEVKKIVT